MVLSPSMAVYRCTAILFSLPVVQVQVQQDAGCNCHSQGIVTATNTFAATPQRERERDSILLLFGGISSIIPLTYFFFFELHGNFFTALLSKYKEMPSYNGGEQGFMNRFFDTFDVNVSVNRALSLNLCRFMREGLAHLQPLVQSCPLFDPQRPPEDSTAPASCARLPPVYNADVGIYFLHKLHWVLAYQILIYII